MSEHEMSRVLTDIRERLVRVETKIDGMRDVRETAEAAEKTANEAGKRCKKKCLSRTERRYSQFGEIRRRWRK